jgi:hypothetical protein
MTLPASGTITLAQIQAEFGGSNPIGLSEYYRNGAYVTSNNTSVPTSGIITVSNFHGAVKAYSIEYQIIGAGGAGGYGLHYGYGSGTNGAGSSSSLTSASITTVTASGGGGGSNASGNPDEGFAASGAGTTYGSGGAGGNNGQSGGGTGGAAPSASYGAGGGGGGGDRSSTYDSSGGSGGGGGAGSYLTGTFTNLVPGTSIAVTIGSKGTSSGGDVAGGSGANGYARLRVAGGTWSNFTSNGTFTVP